jgi:glycosyltransferase involved in cell wall biosynthesis
MKMADAMAESVVSLELLTAGSLLRSAVHRVSLRSWYGVGPRLRVVRLPVYWRLRDPFFAGPPGPRFERAAAAYALWRRPDLVYTRSKRAALHCIRLGLPTIVEAHGSPKDAATQQSAFQELAALAERPALRGVVTVTDYLRRQYRDVGIPDAKLEVWPDAVDLARFDAVPTRDEARRQLGLTRDAPLAVYCGHFYASKGVPCLVDAARRAPDLSFCLVGGSPRDVAAMRERAAGAPNVRFEGFVHQRLVPIYLAAADALVLPNSGGGEHAHATSPLKLFEYMAARRAIVATAIPAFEGRLRDRENALLVEPDAPEALVAALRELAGDADLAQRLADSARRDVEPFTWTRRAREILERFASPGCR